MQASGPYHTKLAHRSFVKHSYYEHLSEYRHGARQLQVVVCGHSDADDGRYTGWTLQNPSQGTGLRWQVGFDFEPGELTEVTQIECRGRRSRFAEY